MAIWLLRQVEPPKFEYEADGVVARARSEPEARALVADKLKDADCWLDKNRSQCVRLEPNGPAAVFLRAFNAG